MSQDLSYFIIQPPPDICNEFNKHIHNKLLNDPKNVLTIILHSDLRKVLNLLYMFVRYSKDRREWEDRIRRNYEVLRESENTIVNEVKQQLELILTNIKRYWNKILYTVLTDKDLETTYRRSLNIYIQKAGSMAYRLRSVLGDKERLREYVRGRGEKFNEIYLRLIKCYESS